MQTKYLLSEDQIPRQWYNIIPDMPGPLAPVINPQTLKPLTPDDMLAIFPMALIEQEMSPAAGSTSRTRSGRSTGSGGRRRSIAPIAWKRRSAPRPDLLQIRGVSPAGSHKPNSAIPQA